MKRRERPCCGAERPQQQTEYRPHRRVGPRNRALQLHPQRERCRLCDVNDLRTKEALQIFPKAKTHHDWRRVLDQKDVEAVIICTADHHHAFIANWALNRDMHVFCEKPLGISVEESRVVRANYLKRKAKVATQHGTQRHAYPNFERVRELILDGAIGELKTVHSWDSPPPPAPRLPGRRRASRLRSCTTNSGSARRPITPTARSTSAVPTA
jgi:predicted dehydrogenase